MRRLKLKARFSVWVGGGEVNDFLVTREEAEDIAQAWRNKGYDDVHIEEYDFVNQMPTRR